MIIIYLFSDFTALYTVMTCFIPAAAQPLTRIVQYRLGRRSVGSVAFSSLGDEVTALIQTSAYRIIKSCQGKASRPSDGGGKCIIHVFDFYLSYSGLTVPHA